jgi:hypothetical protein
VSAICRRRRPFWALLVLTAFVGCGKARPAAPANTPEPSRFVATDFDPAATGTVSGRVTWQGNPPSVPPFEVRNYVPVGSPGQARFLRENPHAPRIDPDTHGVAGAVIFLRGVPLAKARPWDHAPVRVEQRDRRLHIMQGATEAQTAFVRRGDEIEIVSHDGQFHSLHASGAAFFTLTFPDPEQPRRRRLTSNGHVELTSAAGYYWMHAHLFVDDHPYYTRTDAEGQFRLEKVPAGRYEVVCWMPSWLEHRHDRDPETSLITRLFFRPPVERQQAVEVQAGDAAPVTFTLSTSDFER